MLILLTLGTWTLQQAAQQGCGCPLPGSIQGQAGWGFEQPGLEGAVPAYSRGLDHMILKAPSNPTHSMIDSIRKNGTHCYPLMLAEH